MDIDKSSLRKIIQDSAKDQINLYKQAGKSAMKEIRTSIVDEWFGQFSSVSMNVATRYSASSQIVNQGNVIARVTIRSWIDIERYNPEQNAQKWKAKYGGSKDARQYVLDLQLYQGIIGLPEKATYRDTGWVNDHFHQKDPLINRIDDVGRWKEFENVVNKYL